MSTAERDDLISIIVNDHRDVEQVFRELEDRTAQPWHRRAVADHMIAELVRHLVAEEEYLYPAARKHLRVDDEIAKRELRDHVRAARLMKQLEDLDPTDPKFDEILDILMNVVRRHIHEEENDLLPKLQAACSKKELVALGKKVVRAKRIAPTRPHLSSPRTPPPVNRILAPGAGLIDRIRDKVRHRAH